MKRWILGILLFLSGETWAGGQVSGVVTYQGVFPPLKKSTVTMDTQTCGNQVLSEELVIGKKRGIKNAVAYLRGPIEGARTYTVPPGGFVMDQKGCRFEPHIKVVGAGAPLDILNTDQILHNFHTFSRLNPEVNKAQPRSLPKISLVFHRPEIFEVRCDVHDWMHAWIVVAEHPYYSVTDDEGRFRLTDLPAGDYTLNLWHETLGTRGKRIQVREGEETKVEFKLH